MSSHEVYGRGGRPGLIKGGLPSKEMAVNRESFMCSSPVHSVWKRASRIEDSARVFGLERERIRGFFYVVFALP